MKARILLVVLLLASSAEAAKRRPPPSPPRAQPVQPAPDKRPALDAFVQGNYDQAVTLYSALLSSPRLAASDREMVYLNRGYAHLRLNRLDEAAADLRQALALNPTCAEAAAALFALQNRSRSQVANPSVTPVPAGGWGPLARLPGRHWIVSTTAPASYVRYEWGRVGVSMLFDGKDSAGNQISGQYFIDPVHNAIRVSTTYRGKTSISDVDLSPSEFTISTAGKKKSQRQTAQLQPDGTFNIVTLKPKGKDWETLSIATAVPATEQMVATLAWPDQPPPKKPSLLSSILNSMKEGALDGLREGTRQGIEDATRYRVRQITGTPMCQTETGEIVKCP